MRGGAVTFIDSDTHVDECDATWSYIPSSQRDLAPRTIEFATEEIPPFLPLGYHRLWYIDGRLAPRRHRSDERTGTSLETRELTDVGARLRDMQALGVTTQVVYPTIFLHEPSLRPDVTVMLHQSYNRWLADRCAESGGGLRWVAMVPYISPQHAFEEIRFAKDNGAVGIFKLGIEAGGRGAGDPLFFRAYQAAADNELPLCLHQGTPWTPVNKFLSPFTQQSSGETPVYEAFAQLLRARREGRLPKGLRVGFIEAGSAWVPHVLGANGYGSSADMALAELDFYVTCDVAEDIAGVLGAIGEDRHLIVGTDYTHGDRYSVMNAHAAVLGRHDLDRESATRIVGDNARSLYGI